MKKTKVILIEKSGTKQVYSNISEATRQRHCHSGISRDQWYKELSKSGYPFEYNGWTHDQLIINKNRNDEVKKSEEQSGSMENRRKV